MTVLPVGMPSLSTGMFYSVPPNLSVNQVVTRNATENALTPATGFMILTHDNSLSTVTAAGKLAGRQVLSPEKAGQVRKDLMPAEDKVAVAAAKNR